MNVDPRHGARVVILTGTLATSSADSANVEVLRRPAIYETVPRRETPLNLAFPRFRYRVVDDETIVPIPERAAARTCTSIHRR